MLGIVRRTGGEAAFTPQREVPTRQPRHGGARQKPSPMKWVSGLLRPVLLHDPRRQRAGKAARIADGYDSPEGFGKLVSLVEAFLSRPCTTTLQLNVVDRETLLKAQADPTNIAYRTLIVRVWGFSAVFAELLPELQDHVLQRTQHVIC